MSNWMIALFQRPAGDLPNWGRLRWTLNHWLRRLGHPGMAGIGMLVLCPVLYFSAVRPAQERLDAVQQRSASVGERIKRAAAAPAFEQLTPAEQLASFYRIFPNQKSSPRWIEKLVVLAQDKGLSLDQGEYKVARSNDGKLMQLRMTFPVKGEYAQIRKFLSALPDEIPVFSLENVQFERQKISDSLVEAKIRLVLYLGQGS